MARSLPHKILMFHPRLHLFGHGIRILGLGIVPGVITKAEPLAMVFGLCRRNLRSALLCPSVEELGLLLCDECLLLTGLREEGLRLLEGRFYRRLGNAVILDVKKTRVLGCVADGGGEVFALGLGAPEVGEIDDGDLGGVAVPRRGS